VLHEIEGHAVPAARAKALPLSIFAVGTAWGRTTRRVGRSRSSGGRVSSIAGRRRELALRHVTARRWSRGPILTEAARTWCLSRGAFAGRAPDRARVCRAAGSRGRRCICPRSSGWRRRSRPIPISRWCCRPGVASRRADALREWAGA
jgi:hypothetical protein